MNRLIKFANRKPSKREMKIQQTVLLILLNAIIVFLFWEAATNLAGTTTITIENPALPAETTYDPCGLKEVICEGEEEPKRPAIITTYNAEGEQTDSDPLIMASNKKVYEGAVASNCHALGTEIEIDGLGTFVVEDRMNRRYTAECGKPVVLDENGKAVEGERIDIFKWNHKDNFKIELAYYQVQ